MTSSSAQRFKLTLIKNKIQHHSFHPTLTIPLVPNPTDRPRWGRVHPPLRAAALPPGHARQRGAALRRHGGRDALPCRLQQRRLHQPPGVLWAGGSGMDLIVAIILSSFCGMVSVVWYDLLAQSIFFFFFVFFSNLVIVLWFLSVMSRVFFL